MNMIGDVEITGVRSIEHKITFVRQIPGNRRLAPTSTSSTASPVPVLRPSSWWVPSGS